MQENSLANSGRQSSASAGHGRRHPRLPRFGGKPDRSEEPADEIQAELDKLHKEPPRRISPSRAAANTLEEETLKNFSQQAEQAKRMQLNLELARPECNVWEKPDFLSAGELISTPAIQLSNRLGETLIQVEASQRVLQEGGIGERAGSEHPFGRECLAQPPGRPVTVARRRHNTVDPGGAGF